MKSVSSTKPKAIALAIVLTLGALFGPGVSAQQQQDDRNPVGVTGAFEGMITTGCAYNVLNHNARRAIDDIVVPGALGKYGLKLTRYYNSRDITYGGLLGPGWRHGYIWSVSPSRQWKVEYPDGSTLDSECWSDYGAPLGVSDGWENITCTTSCSADFRLADGGTVHFDNSDGNLRARTIKDPHGLITTITYVGGFIDRVTEPGGRYLKFFYSQISGDLRLTRVEAHGLGDATVTDWVNYTYTSQPTGGNVVPSAMCLTRVDYSDGTHADYTYTTDNQPEHTGPPCPCMIKLLPLVSGCNDVRYHGPMSKIAYEYQDQGPHGAILKERYWDGIPGHEGNGVLVSRIDPPAPSPLVDNPIFDTTYTEYRGDGPTRTFNYTELQLIRSHNGEPEVCPESFHGPVPQQFLLSYTDFQGHTTQLGYDANWYINTVTDANNHTTTYLRGPPPNASLGPKGIGQILQITHPDNTQINYGYEPEPSPAIQGHYLKSITDERGNQTVHTRDANFRIIRTDHKDPQGNILVYEEFQYAHNNFGLLSTHHLPSKPGWSGPYVHFQYDSRGLLIAKTNPTNIADWQTAINSAPKTTYTYYTAADGKPGWIDRVKTVTLPANVSGYAASETYEYDRDAGGAAVAGRGLVTKITHADGKYRSFGYDQYGNKLWEENELRKRTSYTYDDYNRVLTVKDPIGQTTGRTTTYTYNPTNGNGGSPYKHTTSNPDTVTTPAGILTTNDYDENFRKISTSTAGKATWFHYDAVGNQDWVADPRGTAGRTWPNADPAYTTYTDYDNRNRKSAVREPLGRTTRFYYDDGINLTRISRPDGTTETKSYDAMNRLQSDTVPQTAQINLTTWFGYWPSGKLIYVVDPNNQTTYFLYNESDEMIAMYYPGLTDYQQWSYDDAHNLATHTTVNGSLNPNSNEVQHFQYDNRNRRTSMSWDNGADSATFTYYDDGRLHTAQNANSTVTRQYDAAGRLIWEQQNLTGFGTVTVNYPSYDDDGRLLRMYLSGGSGYDFTYSYDSMGRFEKISLTPSTLLFQYHYDAASNEIERDSLFNGVNHFYPRDALNRMQYMDVKKGNTVLAHEGYAYDAMNRITSVSYSPGTDSFSYYLDGELNTATLGNLGHNLTYNLDKAGNRTSVVDNNVSSPYTPNALNQYTTAAGNSVVNGPNHQIQTYAGVTYTYINDERLTSAATGSIVYSMAYDALGRCVKRTLTGGPTTYYVYDGDKPILEYDSSGASVGVNVYGKGVDEVLERVAIGADGQWHTYYLHQNHEGSVTLLTDTSGNVLERYRYDVFGAPTIYAPNWISRSATLYDNRFLFTGREYAATYRSTYTTAAFNFYEYRARAYNAKLGRFMSEDPKLFDAGDYNLFRYCHNDPIDNVDPMGLASEQTGLLTSGTVDRVWEMTKWFDRSNLVQGNFEAFGAMSGLLLNQSDKDAKGAISTEQMPGSRTETMQITVNYSRRTSNGLLKLTEGDKILLSGSVVVGGREHPTPTGRFHAGSWEKDHTSKLYGWLSTTPWSKSWWGGNVFGPYQLHIQELESRGIFIHGTVGPGWSPVTWGNRLISPTSHGCIRMCNADIMAMHALLPRPEGISVNITSY